jgi:hypothetical protein
MKSIFTESTSALRVCLRGLVVFTGMLLLCAALFGQGSDGRIVGTITDTSSGSVPGAAVTITDSERGSARALTADSAGAYAAPGLSPGTYSIRVEFQGFKTVERNDIVLQVGQEIRVDVTLQPGAQAEKVTVTAEAPALNTTSAVLGGTLGPGTIQELPLNGRNFMNLLSLRPGVTVYPGGGAWTQTTNGLRPEHNVYLLDGITAIEPLGGQSTINSVSLAGDSATLLPLDTIQEFATQQNAKAEFGWKPGSITSIALKSGTNSYHGTANAFGRTDVLDARNAFLTSDPITGDAQKQEISLQNFGGTFGGPIRKDKLFFFGAYEGQRYSVGNPTAMSYPSLDANAQPISGNTASVIKACQNVDAASRSVTSLKMAGLDANCARTSGYSIFDLTSAFARLRDSNGALGANISGNLNTDYSVDGYMGKVDYNLNEKNTINAKYFYGTHTGLVVNSATITQPYWRPTDTATVQFSGGQWNYIASSSMVNTLRVGYNRFYQKFETTDCPGSGTAPDYGIPFGYGTSKPNCGFTNISLNPFTGAIGCCSSFPKYYGPDNIIEVHDGFSFLRGKHNFKVGGEFRNSDIGNGGTFNRGRGQVTFATLETFISGTPTGNGQIFIGDPRRNLKQKAMAAYFQDDWRIMPRLMLNLGVRYEYLTPLTEGQDRLSNFIPGTGFTQLGKNTDQMYNPDKNNFAPRLGFAWDVNGNGKTVIRGGANMMYVTPGWWMFISQQNANNPTTGLSTNPSGFLLCRGAVNATGAGCAAGVGTDPTVGNIQSAGLPLPPAQVNWNQSSSLYGGNLYPSSTDTSVLKCGTNRLCTAQATDPNLKNGYVYSWSLGVQRALTNTLTLDVGYVGNHATKLIGLQYTNTPFYGAGYCFGYSDAQKAAVTSAGGTCPSTITTATNANATAAQIGRPLNAQYPYLSYIYTVQNLNFSNYNGLQTVLTERPARGLSYTLGFTFAHALDESTGERAGPTGTPFDFRHDYGNSDFDIRKRFTATITYALPGRKGLGQMLEGWKLTSIISIQSALPWGILGSRGGGNDPSGTQEFNDTWNFYGNAGDFSGIGRDAIPYIAGPAAINTPACASKVGAPGSLSYIALQKYGCYLRGGSVLTPPEIGGRGNAVRNMFRGNGIHIWDASLIKDVKFFGERLNAQFRIEAFNILNQVQYGSPQFNGAGGNTPFTNPSVFGASQSTPDVANNNPSLGSGGPREFQLGLKLTF